MDDVLLVDHLECGNQREHKRNRFRHGERPARQPVHECLALQVLHDQEVDAVLTPDIEDRADVGMRERRDRLGLALEPLLQIGIGRDVLGQIG